MPNLNDGQKDGSRVSLNKRTSVENQSMLNPNVRLLPREISMDASGDIYNPLVVSHSLGVDKPQIVWLPVPLVDVCANLLGKKARDLQSLALIIQVWGEAITLSKLQYKIHMHWYSTLYFQVLSASSFIVVFYSEEARNKALEVPFFWLGRNLIFVELWKPLFEPSWFSSKQTLIWFKLPRLPFEFADFDSLQKIGDSFGKFLLSHSVFEDDVFLVKICVLVNSNTSLPRTCNIRSFVGIWHQNIVRHFDWFGQSFVTMDSALFFNMKRGSAKSTSKGLESPSGFIEKHFTNLDSFSWAKMQDILKGSNIPSFVPPSHPSCMNAPSGDGFALDKVKSSVQVNSLAAQYVNISPSHTDVSGKPTYEMGRSGSLPNSTFHKSLDSPFIAPNEHLIAQVQNIINMNNISLDFDVAIE